MKLSYEGPPLVRCNSTYEWACSECGARIQEVFLHLYSAIKHECPKLLEQK